MAANSLKRRGLMFVLSSPSGAGKTTIAHRLLEDDLEIAMSISVTTRPIRPGETDGLDYRFTDRAGFEAMVEAGEFLEWAEVFGHLYGTPKAQIKAGLKEGQDFLFDIDWQGTQQLGQQARGDMASIFLLPPSITELERRLHTRAQDTSEVIQGRMAKASDELSHWAEYDYVIINDDIAISFAQVSAILAVERLKRQRRPGISDFVRGLLADL
jgi:guanylate kinase